MYCTGKFRSIQGQASDRKKIFLPTVAFLFVTMLVTVPSSATCSNATLKGTYGYSHGRVGGEPAVKYVVGQMTADGTGNLTGLWTMSDTGVISTGTFTGTYSISADCTGTLIFSSEAVSDGPTKFNIVLDDGNKGFQMIATKENYDQPGFALPGTCALGKEQVLALNVATLYPELESLIGQLTLNGKGAIAGIISYSADGDTGTADVKGTYTEKADCTGTMRITASALGVTLNFNTVAVNDGDELLLIESDSGKLLPGTAQQ
jgi:hypothetical protein